MINDVSTLSMDRICHDTTVFNLYVMVCIPSLDDTRLSSIDSDAFDVPDWGTCHHT